MARGDYKVGFGVDTTDYAKGLGYQKTLTRAFARDIARIVPNFNKAVASFQVYGVQIKQTTNQQRAFTDQLKSSNVAGNLLADRQQALSQSMQGFVSNVMGAKVSLNELTSSTVAFTRQARLADSQSLFAQVFGQEQKTRLMEFDTQTKQVAKDILIAKAKGDGASVIYHTRRMREIYNERQQAIGSLTEIQQRQQYQTQKKLDTQANQLLASIGINEKALKDVGLDLHEALFNQFLPAKDDAVDDYFINLMKTTEEQRHKYRVDRTFNNQLSNTVMGGQTMQYSNVEYLMAYQDVQDKVLRKALIFEDIQKLLSKESQEGYKSAFLQIQENAQQQEKLNKEKVDFDSYLADALKSQEGSGNHAKEKQLKSMKELEAEADKLRRAISGTTDPYLQKQLSEKLTKVEQEIKRIKSNANIKPLDQRALTQTDAALGSLYSRIAALREQLSKQMSWEEQARLNEEIEKLEKNYHKASIAASKGVTAPKFANDFQDLQKLQKRKAEQIEKSNQGFDYNSILGLADSQLYSEITNKQEEYNKQIEAQVLLYGKYSDAVKELRAGLKEYNKQMGVTTDDNKKNLEGMSSQFGSMSQLMDSAGAKEQAMQFAIQQIIQGQAAQIGAQFTPPKGNVWTGIQAAVAAQASVQTTISSFNSTQNKYATGGIVPGSSFGGDNVHALVNSGEMILNRGQQRNLFDMINGDSRSSGGGAFVLRGTDLIAVTNNTVSKAKKISYRYD